MKSSPVQSDAASEAARISTRRVNARWWLWGLVTAGALLLLVVRGVVRGAAFSGDFTMIYAGGRVWLEGGNPYLLDVLYAAFVSAGGGAERAKDPTWFVALYPPTTYALLGPLGALPWSAARLVWLGLSLVSVGAIAAWAWRWRPRPERPERSGGAGPVAMLWLLPLGLAFMPVHTTLRFGQLGLVVLALCVWAIGTPRRGGEARTESGEPMFAAALSGLLLAVAGGLKPQLAGLFALGLMATARWRTLAWCLVWGLGILAISVGRWMFPDGTALSSWWVALRTNLDAFAGQGFADPRPSNPMAHHMIHLEPLVWRLGSAAGMTGPAVFSTIASASGVVVTVAAAFAAAWRLRGCRPWHEQRQPGAITLWVAAVAATLTLLIAYHRAYDAVLLIVPAVWALRAWARGARVTVALVGLGVLLYLVRLPELVGHVLPQRGTAWHPARLPGWQTLFMHQGTWSLLLMAGSLFLAGTTRRSTSAP
ncbi:MAG: glycosyltransferase family 87 protein, partial [Planctomycetota bacterium]